MGTSLPQTKPEKKQRTCPVTDCQHTIRQSIQIIGTQPEIKTGSVYRYYE